jgi:hypothetical protein
MTLGEDPAVRSRAPGGARRSLVPGRPENLTHFSIRRVGLVVGALTLAVVALIASIAIWRVDIENRSGKPIEHIAVSVAGRRIFGDTLAVDEVASRWFFVPEETSYMVQVTFADATTLTAKVGYLDPLGGFHDRLVIGASAIELQPPASQ